MGYEEEIENAEADATDPSKDVRDGEEDDDVAMEISDSEAELDPSGKDDAVGVHAVTEVCFPQRFAGYGLILFRIAVVPGSQSKGHSKAL